MRPPRSTCTYTLFPYTTALRSALGRFGDLASGAPKLLIALVGDRDEERVDEAVERSGNEKVQRVAVAALRQNLGQLVERDVGLLLGVGKAGAARLVRPARQACQRLPVAVDHRPRRLQHGKPAGGLQLSLAPLVRDFHRRTTQAAVHPLPML